MNNRSQFPVFYDPLLRRWRYFQKVTKFCGLSLSIVLLGFLISIGLRPSLPHLALPDPHKLFAEHHLSLQRFSQSLLPREQGSWLLANNTVTDNPQDRLINHAQNPATTLTPARNIGFFVNWDDNSLTSLKQHINSLDTFMPEWLHLENADGELAIDSPKKQQQVLAFIQAKRPQLPIVPLINNFDSTKMDWDGDKVAKLLHNATARQTLISHLLNFIQENKFAGINIDFESMPAASQADLLTFMQELYQQFHTAGLEVSQSVPIDDTAFNYVALAKVTDYLVMMAYDENSSVDEPGPVASQGWFIKLLKKRLAEVPAQQWVIGLGNYGYDWKGEHPPAQEISFQEAIKIAQESSGTIRLDPQSLNETFDYYDDKNQLHHVWFLDAITAFNQIKALAPESVHGFALWRMGSEDPSYWHILEQSSQLDQSVAQDLEQINEGYEVDYEGRGEILKVTATPKTGKRQIGFNSQLGLITQQKLITYPIAYEITRWGGGNKKKIALTFDDGPDPQFTPKILEILERYNVKATFFIVGMNGTLHPDLLHQLVNQGNEIGSHTFTHPNIATVSSEQLELELNATERLLEGELGLRTVLFRPPYAEDVEPDTPEQVRPLAFTGNLGYYTVGMQIDPLDWSNPGIDRIISETLKQAENGIGNIVLLHDSGGDRSQTVAALPRIIQGLKQRGFELVTVSQLIGLSSRQVMPTTAKNEHFLIDFDKIGFRLFDDFNLFIYGAFIVGISFSIGRLLLIVFLALYEWYKRRKRLYPINYQTKVSVLVPGFNEEKVIVKTVKSILRSHYPSFNVIVIDDGSTDNTYSVLCEHFADHPRVRLLTKTNGGKSEALNMGITQTDAEIIVTLDADTVLNPKALWKLVRHFSRPQVGAVAGNAKVGNRINVMTYWQALEYITSQNLERRAFGLLNCICVVPGAIGAWRREVLIQAGGFVSDTLAEDTDLTLTTLEMGYQVDYEEAAIAWTEAPDTVSGFLKQRFRWMFGTLQAIWKHRHTLLRLRYGTVGTFALPNLLIFQILFPLISPLMDLLMVVSILWAIWQKQQHPDTPSPESVQHILVFYLLFLLVDLLAALVAFALEKQEDWKLIIWLLPQRFFYRQLMYFVAIKSCLKAIQGQLVGWGKLERKSTVMDRV